MERFLAEVTNQEWNAAQDAGRPWSEAVAVLTAKFPDHGELIDAYHSRWPEMLGEALHGTVELLDELRGQGVRLFALSNWSAETFPIAFDRYPFLAWFDGIVISVEVGAAKPDVRIFQALIEPPETVFVDDSEPNVTAATAMGFIALRFHDAEGLRTDLERLGLLAAKSATTEG